MILSSNEGGFKNNKYVDSPSQHFVCVFERKPCPTNSLVKLIKLFHRTFFVRYLIVEPMKCQTFSFQTISSNIFSFQTIPSNIFCSMFDCQPMKCQYRCRAIFSIDCSIEIFRGHFSKVHTLSTPKYNT